MDKKEIMGKLPEVMDAVSACEGLIFAKITGEVIVGQTIIETIDHAAIASQAVKIFKIDFEDAQNGILTDVTLGLEKGALICVKKDKFVLIGLLGDDGRSSMGLLRRQLKNIMK